MVVLSLRTYEHFVNFRINTIFYRPLDSEVLSKAYNTLASLTEGTRLVGIISHVAENNAGYWHMNQGIREVTIIRLARKIPMVINAP